MACDLRPLWRYVLMQLSNPIEWTCLPARDGKKTLNLDESPREVNSQTPVRVHKP